MVVHVQQRFIGNIYKKDSIRMALIFTDFFPIDTPYKNLHSHVDDIVQ